MNIYSNNNQFSAPLPYPVPESVSSDIRFTRMLEPARIGELDAISEYIYMSIIFGEFYPWLSTIFEGIAMTEMKHFEMLSELIMRLGVNPVTNTRIRNQPIDISEDTSGVAPVAARRALQNSIADENAAANEYNRLADLSDDRTVSELLHRIAADEAHHARLLGNAYNKIPVS